MEMSLHPLIPIAQHHGMGDCKGSRSILAHDSGSGGLRICILMALLLTEFQGMGGKRQDPTMGLQVTDFTQFLPPDMSCMRHALLPTVIVNDWSQITELLEEVVRTLGCRSLENTTFKVFVSGIFLMLSVCAIQG